MFDFGFQNWFYSPQLKCKGLNHFGNRFEKLDNLYFLPITNSTVDQLHLLCEKCSQCESTQRINLNSTYNFAITWFKQFELHYLGYLVNNTLVTKKQANENQQREFELKLQVLSNCINDLNHSKIESFILSIQTSKMIQNNMIDQQYEEKQFLAFVKQQSNQLFSLASRHFYNIFLRADVKLKSQEDFNIVQIDVSKDFVFLLENSLLEDKLSQISVYQYPSLEYVDSFQKENMSAKEIVIKSNINSNLLLLQHRKSLRVLDVFATTQKKGENMLKFLINYFYKHNCEIIDFILDDNIIVFIDQAYKLFFVDVLKQQVIFLTKKLQSFQKTNQILETFFHYDKQLLIIELCNKVLTMSLKNIRIQKSSKIASEKILAKSYFCQQNKIKYSVLQQQDNNDISIRNEIVEYSFQCNKRLRKLKLNNSRKFGNVKLSLKKDQRTLIILTNEYISVYDTQKGIQAFCLPFAQKFSANNYDFQGYFLVQNQGRRVLIWKQEKLFERDIRLFFKRL
ncbi:unnamed protein product [Paramecium sonneborni]|uniref:Uncharacterized protein n=1 Tax=Paramecium sonneborni TaxID=65129 RepID=A0A8S1QZB4_9CILI|nr:unnamed protein product [Paramecium sonneborni]